eukprot:scaffold681336_cov41-Prasinocladus_malaysianus.AAC.1
MGLLKWQAVGPLRRGRRRGRAAPDSARDNDRPARCGAEVQPRPYHRGRAFFLRLHFWHNICLTTRLRPVSLTVSGPRGSQDDAAIAQQDGCRGAEQEILVHQGLQEQSQPGAC